MCVLDSVLGEGDALLFQGLTLIAIASGIILWSAFLRKEMDLGMLLLPAGFWAVSGTLDILITAHGAFRDPMREGNLGARIIFMVAGDFGPALASVLWISLWGIVVLAMWRAGKERSHPFMLMALYCLGAGHLLGFASWYQPLCGYSSAVHALFPYPFEPLAIALAGGMLALAHIGMVKTVRGHMMRGSA